MTKLQRIRGVLAGLFMILAALVMALFPEDGYLIVAFVLCVSLLMYGLRMVFYYLTMTRYMVNGKTVLYLGIIILDLGMLMLTMSDTPKIYVLLYLFASHGFSGLVDILRGLEAKKNDAPRWKNSIRHGAINLAMALLCLIFVKNTDVALYVYCIGLFYAGCTRIATAFTRTAIIYIP